MDRDNSFTFIVLLSPRTWKIKMNKKEFKGILYFSGNLFLIWCGCYLILKGLGI